MSRERSEATGARPPAAALRPGAAGGNERRLGLTELRLFRSEVIAARQTQWLGTVMLAPRASFRWFTVVALLSVAGIVALATFGEFTRTARVNGWLLPPQGVVRVHAPRPGVVGTLAVREGSQVQAGDRLFTLSDDLQSTALGDTQVQIAQRLTERRASLTQERAQQKLLLAQQQRALDERTVTLRGEVEQAEREIALMDKRVAIAARAEELHQVQKAEGYISEMRLQLVQSELLEQRVRLGAAQRAKLTAQRALMTITAERAELPIKFDREVSLLERAIAQLEQEQAEAEARREIAVRAPQAGTVTAIQAVPGARADSGVPLLSIMPPAQQLEAHLYGPTRAVGFVRAGQRVTLRYQAYPYQRFGHYEGTVTSVSRTALSPGDLPPQLAGLSGLGTAAGASNEPVYRITVELASQTVTAYGEALPLQAGMTLEADIALERRRLYEWVLDPLYTITGQRGG